MLHELEIYKYRSLHRVRLPLQRLNVITGPNGSGKSNLYRSLWLISRICEGQFAKSIAREGGLLSAMWAGPRLDSKKGVRMSLGFTLDDFNFQLSCGFPAPPPPPGRPFGYDPDIKEEAVWVGKRKVPSGTLLERKKGQVWILDEAGKRVSYPIELRENESILSQLREPQQFPELYKLRDSVRNWRFYHGFRTDEDSPIRSPQISVRTPTLSHDGSDLAGALMTILDSGDRNKLNAIVTQAFPGNTLSVFPSEPDSRTKSPRCTELNIALNVEGCIRTLLARELSDGTLKFLCLAAALLSPRPAELIALNEPEASLHPDLIAPLARLIVEACQFSQIWVSTHSIPLAEAIHELSGIKPIQLQLVNGETYIDRGDD